MGAALGIFGIHNFQNRLQSLAWSLVGLLLLTSCAKNSNFELLDYSRSEDSSSFSATPPDSQGSSSSPNFKAEPLVWESASHPERSDWSKALHQIVRASFSELNRATDIATFCPKYSGLNDAQKINVWSNLFAATSYYESGWKPAVNSVDVGSAADTNTWSVGLLQLSVVDQQSYGFKFGFDFADLQEPIKNLQLGVKIMARQITKRGTVLIPVGGSGLYWSTLHPGGRYDRTESIVQMTSRLSFCR